MISSAKQRLIMYFNRYSSGKPIENTTGTTLFIKENVQPKNRTFDQAS